MWRYVGQRIGVFQFPDGVDGARISAVQYTLPAAQNRSEPSVEPQISAAQVNSYSLTHIVQTEGLFRHQ